MTRRVNRVGFITSMLVIALGLAADPARLRATGGARMQAVTRPDPKALLQAAAEEWEHALANEEQ